MEDFNTGKYNYEREIDFINSFKYPLEDNFYNINNTIVFFMLIKKIY